MVSNRAESFTDLDKLDMVKFAYDVLVLGRSLFSILPQYPQNMNLTSKGDKSGSK